MARPKKSREPEGLTPAAWGVEIVFFDEHRPSAMYGACSVSMDNTQIILALETGETVAYEFADVKSVLSFHSSKYEEETEASDG